MIKYKIVSTFEHFDTKEKLYRIRVTYPSGGITYIVVNDNELQSFNLGE